MQDIKNSALLNSIIECAKQLCQANECPGLTRDYIIVAALTVLKQATSSGDDQEFAEARRLLEHLSNEQEKLDPLLEKWRRTEIPMTERIILSTQKGRALNAAKLSNKAELTAGLYLAEILKEETPGIRSLYRESAGASAQAAAEPARAAQTPDPAPAGDSIQPQQAQKAAGMGEIIRKAKALQSALQDTVLGQQQAVSTFVSGYFQSELQANIQRDRKRPRATFLFAGPPGVGKTFLSEEAARVLSLPFRRFDMSEYADANATDELSGSDANYKASSEGQLTGFVNKNPQCVLLFDEIEKASLDVIHLFLQILDAGRLRDNRTDQEVSFRDAILIFTTNAGKALYESDNPGNLSGLSRDVVLDALAHDINPKTREPFFPAAICSRFASGNVVMFNYLDAHTLRLIVEQRLARHAEDMRESMGIKINIHENVPTALLLAEGASTDARTAQSRADSFFAGELYELFRLLHARSAEAVEGIRTVNFTVNDEGEAESVRRLFAPSERIHALAYSPAPLDFGAEGLSVPILHYASSADDAKAIIDRESIRLVLCDLFSGEWADGERYLNMEDRASAARSFLHAMLERFPGIPVVLIEPAGRAFSDEEKLSYLRKGVRGFLSMQPEGLAGRIKQYTDSIFQQHSMSALARSNQLIRFETAQWLNGTGDTAEIALFDMKLEKAIKAGDTDNVLSLLSTPDVKFADVIGAEDAKQELGFFVSYMQNTRKFRRSGVAAPKGILLYGPPGTGKTMLAKAFAAESNAAFIATEGNQFFKGIVGQGAAMVHRLFATARRYAPAVIFIDEIDTIARARTGRDTDLSQDSEQILTALFAEMDGFGTDPDKPVFVLGATNYSVDPDAKLRLDPAMLRRFDRRILIDLPNLENRRKYLELETGKKDIFNITPQGIDALANRSTGMSLAQLSSILDMAVRTAVRKQQDSVVDATLEEAFETFNSGEARKWSPDTTLRTARHEAGHALISWLCGEKPSYVTIVSRGSFGGYMQFADQEARMGYTKPELLDRIRTALGGRAAEIVCYGKDNGVSTGASGDLRSATEMARQMLCAYGMDEDFGLAVINPDDSSLAAQVQADVNGLLKNQLAEAVRQITLNRARLDALVAELLKSNSLNAQDIDKILSGAV